MLDGWSSYFRTPGDLFPICSRAAFRVLVATACRFGHPFGQTAWRDGKLWVEFVEKHMKNTWNIWVCLKIVHPYTQWFCWSLSLLNGYFIGNIPYFQTNPYAQWMKLQRPAMYSSMKVFVSVHLLSFMMSSKRAIEILECSMMQQGSRATTYIDTYNVRPPRYLSWFITPITMVYGTYNL